MALDYNIPLLLADEARNRAASLLIGSLKMEKDPKKQNCWNLEHPAIRENQHQIGAISYGGNEREVAVKEACAYVEIRFDKSHILTQGLLEQLLDIQLCQNHTNDFLKWRFDKSQLNHQLEEVAQQIVINFKEMKAPI